MSLLSATDKELPMWPFAVYNASFLLGLIFVVMALIDSGPSRLAWAAVSTRGMPFHCGNWCWEIILCWILPRRTAEHGNFSLSSNFVPETNCSCCYKMLVCLLEPLMFLCTNIPLNSHILLLSFACKHNPPRRNSWLLYSSQRINSARPSQRWSQCTVGNYCSYGGPVYQRHCGAVPVMDASQVRRVPWISSSVFCE